MIKRITIIAVLFLGAFGFSQESTSSPYSYYGLGETRFKGTQSSRSMGNLAIEGDSIALNLLNPASYSHLKLTSLAIGGSTSFVNLKNEEESNKAQRTSLDYLAIGIPMGKVGMSFGLIPYSAVGYRVSNSFTNLDGETVTENFKGNGYVNKAYVGLGYSVTKNFSLGLDLQYNFGNIEENNVISNSSAQLASRELNISKISGVTYNLGAMYNRKIYDKYTLFSSVVFSPKAMLHSENSRNIATVTFTGNGSEIVNDQEDVAVENTDVAVSSMLSFGLGIGEKNKWLLGAEYAISKKGTFNNRFKDQISDAVYQDGKRITIGGYYIPKHDSFTSYLSRVVYRAGFRYSETGLVLKGKGIDDYGMNFGFGLPLGYSKIDLGFEMGVRGTTYFNLVRENYFNVSIGLSLSDKWFRKRKID